MMGYDAIDDLKAREDEAKSKSMSETDERLNAIRERYVALPTDMQWLLLRHDTLQQENARLKAPLTPSEWFDVAETLPDALQHSKVCIANAVIARRAEGTGDA